MKKLSLAALTSLSLLSTGAQAGLMGASEIVITSATGMWLQVSEVIAVETGTGNDLALLSAGASAEGSGNWNAASNPDNAIDGTYPAAFPNIYHSDGNGSDEFLRIFLAAPSELDSISIFGRVDCCSSRDIFNIEIFDENSNLLSSFQNVDATDTLLGGSVDLVGATVSTPASIALIGCGILGVAAARRSKRS